MAMQVNLTKDSIAKKGLIGFSWTTFFFGFFVPLLRADWIVFIVLFFLQLVTFGVASLVFAFIYNKMYTRNLIEKQGFLPADDYSRQILIQAGIIQGS